MRENGDSSLSSFPPSSSTMPGRLLSLVKPEASSSPLSHSRRNSDELSQASATSSSTAPKSNGKKTIAAGPMEHLKRHSFGAPKRQSSDKPEKEQKQKVASTPLSRQTSKQKPKLKLLWESPPNIFFGTAESSTGALFSGQLLLAVPDPEITLTSLQLRLVAQVTAKKPVSANCSQCQTKTTELQSWTFVKEPRRLKNGEHDFPFSYLLPGHLPTTTRGHLGVLEYYLKASATISEAPNDEITLNYHLPISRAVDPRNEKHHTRVFPPTNLTAHCTFHPVIHPIGDFNVHMRINGILEKGDTQHKRWRLRKFTWRLEERETMISPACPKHAAKLAGGEGKGIQHEDVRTIGLDEVLDGWKTDLGDGVIECEFTCRPAGHHRPLCDVRSPAGLAVTHSLVLELVVVEEVAPNKKPAHATPTGAARVLRMVFAVHITERAGLGIAWDEEQPPVYEDVPPSPPMYAHDSWAAAERRAALVGGQSGQPGRGQSEQQQHVESGFVEDYTGPPIEEPPDDMLQPLSVASPSPTASAPAGGYFGGGRTQLRLAADDFEVTGLYRPPREEEEQRENTGDDVREGETR